MTRKIHGMTASELMAKLQADPAFRAREAKDEEKMRRLDEHFARLEAPILRDLAARGFVAMSLDDILDKHLPLPEPIVEVILSWIPRVEDERLLESLIRRLGASKKSFDGRPLAACFDKTRSEGIKWAIINTIAIVGPTSIEDWLAKTLKSDTWRKTYSALVPKKRRKRK